MPPKKNNGITIRPQVKRLLEKQNMTQTQLAEDLGVSRQYVNQLLDAQNLSLEWLFKLAEKFRVSVYELWPDQRLCMHQQTASRSTAGMVQRSVLRHFPASLPATYTGMNPVISFPGDEQTDAEQIHQVPFYDNLYAGAGSFQDPFVAGIKPSSYIQLPGVEDCNFACRVEGDSMADYIRNRSIVVGRELEDRRLVHWGKAYIVLTEQELMVKYVRRHQDADKVRLVNHNPAYDDIDRSWDDIRMLFEVRIVINY